MTYNFITNLIPGFGDLPQPWIPREDFSQCTFSNTATLDAYTKTFVAGLLLESNELLEGQKWEQIDSDGGTLMQALGIAIYFQTWGLSWVHSTYPNYKLGGSYTDDPHFSVNCAPSGFGDGSAANADCGNYGRDYYSTSAVEQFSWDD